MSLRRFLYISPFFPPMARVGALRPLKFARHLPAFGWAPVVLADLRAGDGVNPELLAELPDSTRVRWDYGRQAAANKAALDRGAFGQAKQGSSAASSAPPKLSFGKRLEAALPAALIPDPENIPLGKHLLDIPHALAVAREQLAAEPCEAIVVNADPYAALLVGERLSRETGLPLISDLRDPWALCSLRRPKRARPQRALVDRLERGVMQQSAAVILNTHTSRRDYIAHYAELPADRFHTIYNHGDPELVARGQHSGFERFTMLFLGNFRRFVEGDNLLEALAELRRRGLTGEDIALVVSGHCPDSSRERARSLGVEDMLATHPFVPYLEIGPFMAAADLLISLSNDTEQRIPAKVFDYATSERPILAVGDTGELLELMQRLPGARCAGRTDAQGIADAMQAEFDAGRQRSCPRTDTGLDSRSASAELAALLDAVTGQGDSIERRA